MVCCRWLTAGLNPSHRRLLQGSATEGVIASDLQENMLVMQGSLDMVLRTNAKGALTWDGPDSPIRDFKQWSDMDSWE
jgi:hypothetical protein